MTTWVHQISFCFCFRSKTFSASCSETSAGLWSNNLQDFLVDLFFLSVDVGISHLAVLIPGKEKGAASLNSEHIVVLNWKVLNAPSTHTKRNRVHTWSGAGHTHMFPCFWRSCEVITVGVKHGSVFRWRRRCWEYCLKGTFTERDAVQVLVVQEPGWTQLLLRQAKSAEQEKVEKSHEFIPDLTRYLFLCVNWLIFPQDFFPGGQLVPPFAHLCTQRKQDVTPGRYIYTAAANVC